jgi:hypothetical protein
MPIRGPLVGVGYTEQSFLGNADYEQWRLIPIDQARHILGSRREQHRGNMLLNVQGIKHLAEMGV